MVIRYAGDIELATGGTITSPSGYKVHTFTGSGTFATNATIPQVIGYRVN
jgi:hypothetical protein